MNIREIIGIITAFAVVILLALLSACGGGSGSSLPPIGQLPADQPPIEGRIVWVGDDVTYRWCQPQYTTPWQIVQLDTPVEGICDAYEGYTSDQVYALLPTILAQRPDFVVLEMGLNDIRRGQLPDLNALIEMVQVFQQRGVHVVLTTLPPSAGYLPGIQSWNTEVLSVAQTYNVPLADYYLGMTNPTTQAEVVQFDLSLVGKPLMDGVYPTAAGYEIMWDVACEISGIGGPQS